MSIELTPDQIKVFAEFAKQEKCDAIDCANIVGNCQGHAVDDVNKCCAGKFPKTTNHPNAAYYLDTECKPMSLTKEQLKGVMEMKKNK